MRTTYRGRFETGEVDEAGATEPFFRTCKARSLDEARVLLERAEAFDTVTLGLVPAVLVEVQPEP